MASLRAVTGRISALRSPASLGAKLVLILTGVGLAGSIALTLLLASVITPSFNQLETRSISQHVDRTRAALAEYASKVESAVRDYGDWTSSYDYMAAPSAKFERESFSPLAMTNLDVNGMAYIGTDGRIVIARWQKNGIDDPAMRARLIAAIRNIPFAQAVGKGNSASFYTRLGSQLAAVGVAQVRRSDGTGVSRGYVLMARQISSAQIAGLLQLGARLDLANASDAETITTAPGLMTITVPVRGVTGHAVASAVFSVPRDLSNLGQRMLILAIGGSTLLLVVLLVVLRRMFTRLVLRPLHRVESHMQVVRQSGSLGLLEEEGRHDEIGSLGTSFNSMLRQLKDLREQLEVQSFALGRNESAVAVMHNVRNALNPISTIISKGIAQPPPIDRATLDRAVAELAREDLPQTRREKLVAFVAAAVEAETRDRDERRAQLQDGREAMSQVLEIIGAQQHAAHERPALEPCNVTEIVAQNATIARYSGDVSIMFGFPAQPHHVMANRLILSQVIGNLFANAAEAIAAKGTQSGAVTVTIDELDSGQTRVAIRDDGEGFEPQVGATLFQRGYSTRGHKSGGLGLHWCANSMNAMEGALRLESEGAGRGANAILTLQAAPAEASAVGIAA
ncbi:MAG: CHASE4 domain-containing protein [Pseudomonadota bacterium]|uniref:CHASE4 domain-containing protein n=1 Tax=Sphingomonas sp. ERG5 TaxID=1381597 RepID=UPI00068B2266|nr:CHASE4 domain-containing protein [Sphingomonas sp. ERG5]